MIVMTRYNRFFSNLFGHKIKQVFVFRFLVEVWKPCLSIQYGTVHKLFARSSASSNSLSNTSLVGIQLMGILLANGLPPYEVMHKNVRY
jgi:hypothetical protein